MTASTGDGSRGQGAGTRHRFGPVVVAVAVRPRLWGVAVAQALRLAAPGWWRRWPPLPRPDPAYLRFRLQTASGDPDAPPRPDEVVAYLEWCRQFRRLG